MNPAESLREQSRFYCISLLVVLGFQLHAFVVDQRQFGVVYALGQIKEVITEPGLNFCCPPVPERHYIDKRLLTLDSTDTEPMLTAEKQRGDRLVCALAYFRAHRVHPQRRDWMRRRCHATESCCAQNAFQEEINKRTVKELLSTVARSFDGRCQARGAGDCSVAPNPGVDVVDVCITRVDYVEAITESVYRRMEAERKRVANELRSTGGCRR